MRLFLNNNNNIARLLTWKFIGLSMVWILCIVWCSFINFNIKNLFFFYDFFSITYFTFVFLIYHFTLASTVITRSLTLSVHTWSNHLHTSYRSTTPTSTTFLYGTIFAAFTTTGLADALSIYSNFCLFTCVNLLQSHF